MKTVTKLLALASIGFAAFLTNPAAKAAIGQWDFNSSNLTATVGATLGDMTYNDGNTAAVTQFGTTTGFGISNILGTNAIVMKFPATTNGLGYRVPTPPANFGSTVNQYTYILDVFYPQASDGKVRPLIQTEDGTHLGSQQYIIVNAAGAIGPAKIGSGGVTGPFVGQLLTNTWYRVAISVIAGGTIRVYTNGVAMGSFPGDLADRFFALDPGTSALVLSSTDTNSASGYVNSIQIRDSALGAGQIAALGAASAAGIPLVIPPVPSFIASRTPDVGQTGVSHVPAINVVLDQGDTTVTEGTIQLKLDGVVVPASVSNSSPTFTITYQVPPRLDPLSAHTLSLTYTDSVLGSQTKTWSFTVKDYQVVTLPAPFYFENFNSLTENPTSGVALPAGWSVTNQSSSYGIANDLAYRQSDSYKGWILVSHSRFIDWGDTTIREHGTGDLGDQNRTNFPTIILNGTELTSGLTTGNLLWTESDKRGTAQGEFADVYTAPISCVGKSNVFLAFNSIYMQNNDNMDFIEYTIDGGANWLPALYMFQYPPDDQQPVPQIIYTNNAGGTPIIDVTATFSQIAPTRNWSPDVSPTHATNYGSYIKAPITSALIPFIKGVVNDSELDGKRIQVIRLAAADGQANVRIRLNANGTSSWFWGIDDFGLYEINTPVITGHPANAQIAAATGTTFTVVASSPSP